MDGSLTAELCHDFVDQLETTSLGANEPSALRFRVGLAWQACGENERSRGAYAAIQGDDLLFAAAQNNLAVLASRSGLRSQAKHHLLQAIQHDPSLRVAQINLGHADRKRYRASGTLDAFESSQRRFQSVLLMDPEDSDAHIGLARLYYDRAAHGQSSYAVLARFALGEAARLEAARGVRSAESINLAGLLDLHSGHVSRALRGFEDAISIDPNALAPRINAAYVLLRTRDFRAAARHLEVASGSLGDRSVTVALALGVARAGSKEFDEALEAYGHARELGPSDPRVDYNLAALHEHHLATADGDPFDSLRAAVDHYERFLARAVGDPRYASAAARAQARLEALRGWDDVVCRPTLNDDVAVELERLYREQEALERARLLELERRALEALSK